GRHRPRGAASAGEQSSAACGTPREIGSGLPAPPCMITSARPRTQRKRPDAGVPRGQALPFPRGGVDNGLSVSPDPATGAPMNRWHFLPALVAMALLVGCRQESPLGEVRPVPKKTDEQGWPLYEQPADGFALAVPPSWTALQVNPQTLDRILEQAIQNN